MARVRWLGEARDDLERLHGFIAEHSAAAADRAVRTLVQAAGSLAGFPEMGRPSDLEKGFRELSVPFGSRGYVIRYRLHEDDVIIVRVWHALEDRQSFPKGPV